MMEQQQLRAVEFQLMDSLNTAMPVHMSMKQALMDQDQGDDTQSISSYGHDSPVTPNIKQGDDTDFKTPPNGETLYK